MVHGLVLICLCRASSILADLYLSDQVWCKLYAAQNAVAWPPCFKIILTAALPFGHLYPLGQPVSFKWGIYQVLIKKIMDNLSPTVSDKMQTLWTHISLNVSQPPFVEYWYYTERTTVWLQSLNKYNTLSCIYSPKHHYWTHTLTFNVLPSRPLSVFLQLHLYAIKCFIFTLSLLPNLYLINVVSTDAAVGHKLSGRCSTHNSIVKGKRNKEETIQKSDVM